jgi:hypothetical protein
MNTSLGPSVEYLSSGREYVLDRSDGHTMFKAVVISSAARDQGYTLRKGLALGKITASGKYAQYNDAASDGTQTFRGFLDEEVDLRDIEGNFVDYSTKMLIWGRVNSSNVFGIDANGKTDAANGQAGCFFIWD